MMKIVKNYTIGLFVVLLLTTCVKTPTALVELKIDGYTMGTTYMVKVIAMKSKNSAVLKQNLQKQIDSLLYKIDKIQMSTYSPESELSRFNQYAKTDWFAVSAELAAVIAESHKIYRQTGGAFDITVGPLVNLWGFGPTEQKSAIPSSAEITAQKKLVGQNNISVNFNPPAVRKTMPAAYCDLSAVAKGYAVDAAAEFLAAAGYENYLVEIGGEIRAGGSKANGKVWRIGVATPVNKGGIQKVVRVSNTGMATSGDYLNYFEKDGIRYSHTIDPQTGRPITHKLASVTVIDPSCMAADGYATAIDVMGPEKGFDFALKMNLPVFMIIRSENGFIEKMTPQFKKVFMKK